MRENAALRYQKDTGEGCAITDEDLRAALKEIGIYIDVTLDDLKTIYSLALKNANMRKAEGA